MAVKTISWSWILSLMRKFILVLGFSILCVFGFSCVLLDDVIEIVETRRLLFFEVWWCFGCVLRNVVFAGGSV